MLEAGAGASLATVCRYALQQSLTGLEFAWGIPGSIGGAAFMNAGAYGEEMKDVVLSCTHMNLMAPLKLILQNNWILHTDTVFIKSHMELYYQLRFN